MAEEIMAEIDHMRGQAIVKCPSCGREGAALRRVGGCVVRRLSGLNVKCWEMVVKCFACEAATEHKNHPCPACGRTRTVFWLGGKTCHLCEPPPSSWFRLVERNVLGWKFLLFEDQALILDQTLAYTSFRLKSVFKKKTGVLPPLEAWLAVWQEDGGGLGNKATRERSMSVRKWLSDFWAISVEQWQAPVVQPLEASEAPDSVAGSVP